MSQPPPVPEHPSPLLRRTSELGLSIRACNGLANARIEYVFQLVTRTEAEILKTRNLGGKSMREIVSSIEALGLRLGMHLPIDPKRYASSKAARNALFKILTTETEPSGQALGATRPTSSLSQDILDEPWQDHLVLSTRAWNGLTQSGLRTLGEVLGAAPADLLAVRNLGKESLKDLATSIASFEKKHEGAIALVHTRRLTELGIQDEPASRLGPALRFALAPIEARYGAQTLGSLAALLPHLHSAPGFRADHVRQLTRAMHLARKEGLRPVPERLADFVLFLFQQIQPRERDAVTLRYLGGTTRVEKGTGHNVNRGHMRQIIRTVRFRFQKRWGAQATVLIQPILARFDAAGGLLHAHDAEDLLDGVDVGTAMLVAHIAGRLDVETWKGAFLVRKGKDPRAIIRSLARVFHQTGRDQLAVQEIVALAAQHLDRPLPEATLLSLLDMGLGYDTTKTGPLVLQDESRTKVRLVSLLRERARPMHALELAQEIDPSLRPDGLESPPSREQRIVVQRVQSSLERTDEVFRVGAGTFVHRDALPITPEQLEGAVNWCVQRIAGRSTATSTQTLLQEMEAVGPVPPGLNAYLLKDAMKRHPDAITLRTLHVAHAATWETTAENAPPHAPLIQTRLL